MKFNCSAQHSLAYGLLLPYYAWPHNMAKYVEFSQTIKFYKGLKMYNNLFNDLDYVHCAVEKNQ